MVQPTSPPKWGESLEIVPSNVAKLWGKAPLTAILDPRITDLGFRILALMAVEIWRHDVAVISFAEIALALHRSERTIQYEIKRLLTLGIITAEKAKNKANIYRIASPVFAERSTKQPDSLHNCAICGEIRKVSSKTCWCKPCTAKQEAARKAGTSGAIAELAARVTATARRA